MNVLIIDAMPPLQFLCLMLAQAGFKIHQISNGNALELTVKAFAYPLAQEYNINLKLPQSRAQVL
jgi:hypothetical protein